MLTHDREESLPSESYEAAPGRDSTALQIALLRHPFIFILPGSQAKARRIKLFSFVFFTKKNSGDLERS